LLFGLLCAVLAAYLIVHLLDEPGRLSLLIERKTADLKEIAWMQSHRVRAPLARIMALVALLSPETFDPEEDKEVVNELKKSSEELDDIIRDIVKRTESQA
jgi:light-regulated signal transduction histidine kinase (bacteriophytochrome)